MVPTISNVKTFALSLSVIFLQIRLKMNIIDTSIFVDARVL